MTSLFTFKMSVGDACNLELHGKTLARELVDRANNEFLKERPEMASQFTTFGLGCDGKEFIITFYQQQEE